jgi:peptidoglycan/LPS O-acetylase OafA/YrhL
VNPLRTPSLDAFRVVAVSCVMLAHGVFLGIDAFPWLRYITFIFGVLGVELFFVLSGFLIGRQLLDVALATQSVKSFWWRRWFRTLPNYYLFLLLNVVLYTTILHKPAGDFSFLIFSHALVSPFSGVFFAESWSLAIEEWFYFLAPVLVVVCSSVIPIRHRRFSVLWVMIGIIIASAIARLWVAQETTASIDGALRKMVLLRLDAIAFGVLLAWVERYSAPLLANISRLWWIGALAVLLASFYVATLSQSLAILATPIDTDRVLAPLLFTLLPFGCALLLAGAAGLRLREREWVGNNSKWAYSMYLLHFPLLLLVLHVIGPLNDPLALVLGVAAWYASTMFGAALIYRWYERPCMNLRERFVPLGK